MNETPESDPVFKNAITDSAYVPHGLPPVVAHEVQLQDFNVNNVHGLPPVVAHEVQLQDFNVNNVHGLPPVVAHEVQLQDFNVNNVNII